MQEISERASLVRESRSYTVDALELRADPENEGLRFEGIASVVDTPYSVRDQFGEFEETIKLGAFNRTIKQKADVRLLVNHDGIPLARTKSKTLQLFADPHLRALAPRLDPANPTVQEVRSATGRGDLDQMSIGFRVRNQEWSPDYTERTILEVELFDVSIVTYPASPTTSASMRSLDEFVQSLRSEEVDADEVRRAIAHLESLLPAETEEVRETDPAALAEYYQHLRDLWDKRAA